MASTISSVFSDARIAAILAGDFMKLAADRTAVPNHPVIQRGYAGALTGSGTLSKQVPVLGFGGYDLLDSVAEGAAVVAQEILDASFTVTASRHAKAYEPSDELRFTDATGALNTAAFARDAFDSYQVALMDAVARLVGGFDEDMSTSGTNLSTQSFLTAIALLEIAASQFIEDGGAMAVLHLQQMADLRYDLAAVATGLVPFNPAGSIPADAMNARGAGYAGRFFGVDIYASNRVPTANAGADRAGGIMLPGAMAWVDAPPYADGADQVVLGGKVLFERTRSAQNGLTQFVTSSIFGVSRALDSAALGHRLGVSVITDA